jgi:hypothetical protein
VAENAEESVVIERGELLPREVEKLLRGSELGDARGHGTVIVRTDFLALVASIDAVAHGGRYPSRQVAAPLDELAGEATAGVGTDSTREGTTGTVLLTEAARAAGGGARLVGCDGERGEELAQEKERATAGDDEKIATADESDAGTLSPVAFTHWGCIHAHAGRGSIVEGNESCEGRESVAEHFVIVGAVGVVGELRNVGRLSDGRKIVHGKGNHGSGAGKERARVVAQVAEACGIVHAVIFSIAEPEAVLVNGIRVHTVGASETASVESQLGGFEADSLFDIRV